MFVLFINQDKQIQHKYYPNKRSDVEAFPNYYSSYPTSLLVGSSGVFCHLLFCHCSLHWNLHLVLFFCLCAFWLRVSLTCNVGWPAMLERFVPLWIQCAGNAAAEFFREKWWCSWGLREGLNFWLLLNTGTVRDYWSKSVEMQMFGF